jgi:hypothetical protein
MVKIKAVKQIKAPNKCRMVYSTSTPTCISLPHVTIQCSFSKYAIMKTKCFARRCSWTAFSVRLGVSFVHKYYLRLIDFSLFVSVSDLLMIHTPSFETMCLAKVYWRSITTFAFSTLSSSRLSGSTETSMAVCTT